MSLGAVQDATEGDNKEFAVDGTKTVTIHINDSTKTSTDDTDTDKYFNNLLSASSIAYCGSGTAFFLRANQTITITKINDITFTDPITVTDNKGHREEFNTRILETITIRTGQATGTITQVYLRVK